MAASALRATIAATAPLLLTTFAGALTIEGAVSGASGDHAVRISLQDREAFDSGKALQTVVKNPDELEDGTVSYRFEAPAGTYTIVAIEDEDGDGKLDMGLVLPAEPVQFFRRFEAWRAPRFDDVTFALKADLKNADIELE